MTTTITPAATLAEKLAADATGARDVWIRIEDAHTRDHRTGHDGAVLCRDGTQRTVTVARRLDGQTIVEVTHGGPARAPELSVAVRPDTLVRQTILDPATGRPCPHVLGAELQETAAAITVLHGGRLSQWQHRRRRLWHWIDGTGGSHLEGAVAWGDRLPDPSVPRRQRVELLSARGASDQIEGTMPVLLRPQVAMHLVDLLADVLNGQNVLGGMRMLHRRVGRRIAASCVTVVDDGRLDGPHGALVDDEGVPTARNMLVESGVLRGFLHSRTTAERCGDKPNGCGLRHLPGGRVHPGPRCLQVLPGPDDLVLDQLDGVLEAVAVGRRATRSGGGRTVRLEVFGWVVRDGSRRYPVGPVAIETGLFGWLRSVRACGPSLHYSALFRGLAAPSLLLSEANVRGVA